jgi:hypothetical protein
MNNSPQYPLQVSRRLRNLCELASLNVGEPSSNPIRCANQDNERKDPGRGIGPVIAQVVGWAKLTQTTK